MALYSPLVSLLVVILINFLWVECGTRADSRLRLHSTSAPSNKLCLRLCKWIIKNQKKRQTISLGECIKDCEQGKTPRDPEKKHDLASTRFRMQRNIKAENDLCHGLSDHGGVPLMGPVPAKILNVDIKAHSSEEYHYNVSWKPLDKAAFQVNNWTHYSLLYHFYGENHDGGQRMKCVLVPKNNTNWILKHRLWAPNNQPDRLLSAVVSYPFRRNDAARLELHEYDPLKKFIPTFIPVFATTKASKFNIGAPIAGGSIALLIILLMVIFWRRSRLCHLSYRDPVRQQVAATPNNIIEAPAIVNLPSPPENNQELYYSCYYPENDAFREKVASIVNLFRKRGYDVTMDAMVSSEISSQGPTRWAETQIRRASKVLVFLSPSLVKLESDGYEGMQSQDINRVWVELQVLRDIYTRNHSAAKMVCITFSDAPVKSANLPLWAEVSYKWPNDFEEILRRLNDRPAFLPG